MALEGEIVRCMLCGDQANCQIGDQGRLAMFLANRTSHESLMRPSIEDIHMAL